MNLGNKVILDIMQSLADSHLREVYKELTDEKYTEKAYFVKTSYFNQVITHIEAALLLKEPIDKDLIHLYFIKEAARRWYHNIPFIEAEPEYYESKMNSDD